MQHWHIYYQLFINNGDKEKTFFIPILLYALKTLLFHYPMVYISFGRREVHTYLEKFPSVGYKR